MRIHVVSSIFIPAFLALSLTACVQEIDMTTGERQVAVECILSDEPVQTLRLSLTSGATGIEANALDGATAVLSDLTESAVAGTFERKADGEWTLDYFALPGHSYKLEVEVPGYGTVRADDTMPEAMDIHYLRGFQVVDPPLDSAYFLHRYTDPVVGEVDHSINGMFVETASVPDHLLVFACRYDEVYRSHQLLWAVCTDCPGADSRNITGLTYKSETLTDKGSIRKISPHLEGFPYYRDFVRIEKAKALTRRFFSIQGDFSPEEKSWGWWPGSPSFFPPGQSGFPLPFVPMKEDNAYFLFMAISENYSAYLDDAMVKQGSDLSSVFIRDPAFTNVVGGVGIFGSAVTQKLPVNMGSTIWEVNDYE